MKGGAGLVRASDWARLHTQTAPTDDACFSTETGLERTGSLGWTEEAGEQNWRMPNCLWWDRATAGRSPSSDWITSLQKQRKKGVGELARGRSDAKVRFLFEGKERDAPQRVLTFSFLLTFYHGDDYLFITYLVPNLRAAGILFHWIKYFLPLSNEILKGNGYQRLSPFLFDET